MIKVLNPDDGDEVDIAGGTRLRFLPSTQQVIIDSDRQYCELTIGTWEKRDHSNLSLWWDETGTVVLMIRRFALEIVRLRVRAEISDVVPVLRRLDGLYKVREKWIECATGVVLECEVGLSAFDKGGELTWHIEDLFPDFYVSGLGETDIEVSGMNWGPVIYDLRTGQKIVRGQSSDPPQ